MTLPVMAVATESAKGQNGHTVNGAEPGPSRLAASSRQVDAAPLRKTVSIAGIKTLPLSIQGRQATVSYDGELLWLHRAALTHEDGAASAREARSNGDGESSTKPAKHDPVSAYLCVPHALVLHSSFIPDSDGGSLLLRLLAPPTGTARSPFTPWKTSKTRAAQLAEMRSELDAKNVNEPAERLAAYLDGPCSNLRLVKIEARISDLSITGDAATWASTLMQSAYAGVKPYRKLRVLVNPIGGPGKAASIYQGRVLPIFEAAGCTVDMTVTTHYEHGLEIARDLDLSKGYDAIVCVSGDGMLHEVLNGLAQRRDAREALSIPLVPIPAGSGNAVALNLLGVAQGFNLALACLGVIKGKGMDVDVCCVTQPQDAQPDEVRPTPIRSPSKRGRQASSNGTNGSSETAGSNAAQMSSPYSVSYSFLSQAIGLMADVDLGTEDMRALGDTRFVIGYITGVLSNRACECDIYVKLGSEGTLEKKVMRQRTKDVSDSIRDGVAPPAKREGEPEISAEGQGVRPTLKNGAVTDTLPSAGRDDSGNLPSLVPVDPSWPQSLLPKTKADTTNPATVSTSQWYKLDANISALYGGKIPFVSRDLLQFPFALPSDGCVDVALQLHDGGRAAKLRAISGAETGIIVYDPAVVYLKCEAYRVVPRLAAGDKRLKKGGLVSIDGEAKPYRAFQVEVDGRIKMRFLSLFGKWQCPDGVPPSIASS